MTVSKYSLHGDWCKWHEDQRDSDCTCKGLTNHPANCGWHFEQYPFECNCGYYTVCKKCNRAYDPAPIGTIHKCQCGAIMAHAGTFQCVAASDFVAPAPRNGDWMQTYLGNQCWPIDPRPEEIHLFDIAHSLAMQCRYNGHCERFYSVAEHSVHVSRVVPREYALIGLLHDATEAYVCDIPRPLKPFLANYDEIEERMWIAIADRFGLPHEMPPEIKEADNAVLLAEAEVIMKPHPAPWGIEGDPANVEIKCWSPSSAEMRFKQRFLEIIVDIDSGDRAEELIGIYREGVA